jgi:hypothetical protein
MTFEKMTVIKIIITFVLLFLLLGVLMVKLELREVVFHSTAFDNYKATAIIVPIGISIFTALAGYWFAKRKNRSQKKWAVLCFFLNIWGLIILFFLPALRLGRLNEISSPN